MFTATNSISCPWRKGYIGFESEVQRYSIKIDRCLSARFALLSFVTREAKSTDDSVCAFSSRCVQNTHKHLEILFLS